MADMFLVNTGRSFNHGQSCFYKKSCSITPQFNALQRFLVAAPERMNASSHVDVSNIKDFLQRLATIGFKEAADAIAEELIEE